VHVGGAGEGGDLGLDLPREGVIPGGVERGTLDLHVDRGGDPEIEHLGDDVGRREVKGQAGKPGGQVAGDQVHVAGRRRVPGLERDQDLAVRGRT
jgi:hypothetical protein